MEPDPLTSQVRNNSDSVDTAVSSEKWLPSVRWRWMDRAYVSTCQRREEGVKQLGLTAWHLPPFLCASSNKCPSPRLTTGSCCVQKELPVPVSWPALMWLWDGLDGLFRREAGMKCLVETWNVCVGVNVGLKKTSLFLVNAKPKNSALFFLSVWRKNMT